METTASLRIPASQVPSHQVLLTEAPQDKRSGLWAMHSAKVPLLIDYGSETIKAGYMSSYNVEEPTLIFRPQVSKTRDPSKNYMPIKAAINTSYDQLDLNKNNFKSPFEKNIILHFSVLEQCNDYIFSELVKPGKKCQSPMFISYPFANPLHCRSAILNQLFHCYEIDNIFVGVDALFAYFYELDCDLYKYKNSTALVVHMGANTIHTFAIIKGKVEFSSVRRINVGGSTAFDLFGRTLTLKNPSVKSRLSYKFLRDLYEEYTQVAYDYKYQLRYFYYKITGKKNIHKAINPETYQNLIEYYNKMLENYMNYYIKFVEIVYIDFYTVVYVAEEYLKRKEEMKIRMAEKLRETIYRRKYLKKKMHEVYLKQLTELRDRYEAGDKEAHYYVVYSFGPHKFFDKLLKKIQSLESKLGLLPEKLEYQKFPLLYIPDHELTSYKLKLKRIQQYQKNLLYQKQQKQKQKEEEERKMKYLRENNPNAYLQLLRYKHRALAYRIKANYQMRSDLNSRKSRIKQKRMQILARMAYEEYDSYREGNYEEMEVFREPYESDHYSYMYVMYAYLREIDPEYSSTRKDIHHLNSANEIFLTSELVKCHEIYFYPRLVGVQQDGVIGGIVGTLYSVNNNFHHELLTSIIIIGGGSKVPGLSARIAKDLRAECPTGVDINVKIGKGGALGTYFGMQGVAQIVTKNKYNGWFSKKGRNDVIDFGENLWSNPKPPKFE